MLEAERGLAVSILGFFVSVTRTFRLPGHPEKCFSTASDVRLLLCGGYLGRGNGFRKASRIQHLKRGP